MNLIKRFFGFWYDFIIGDEWFIAAGVVAGLWLTGVLVQHEINAWWLMPVAMTIVLGVSLWREVSKTEQTS